MTDEFLANYLHNRHYYEIEARGQIDNPDQRIMEDIRAITRTSLMFLLILLGSLIDLISSSGIPWSKSALLVVVVIGYSLLGTGITAIIGRRLVRLNFNQLRYEADFRYSLVHVRDNTESIAFYQGEKPEIEHTRGRFRPAPADPDDARPPTDPDPEPDRGAGTPGQPAGRRPERRRQKLASQGRCRAVDPGPGDRPAPAAGGHLLSAPAPLHASGVPAGPVDLPPAWNRAARDLQQILATVRLGDLPARVGGFDTVLDRADVLSLGEQQRLAFARLLVNRPSYAVLDEATSALDVANEANLYGRLQELGITDISVGHRPGVIAFHDRVLELLAPADRPRVPGHRRRPLAG